MGYKEILLDIKTYLSIRLKNPRRFKDSKIESFVSKSIMIGKFVTIKKNVHLTESLKSIGTGTYIGDYTSIYNCESVGNYCSISHGVKIGLENHLLNHLSTSPLLYNKSHREKPVVIQHDVLISANSLILSGVTLGTGCVVGAGSFVNSDVPPYAIVAGSPAKIIRFRFEEDEIKDLLDSKWWEKDHKDLLDIRSASDDLKSVLKNLKNV